MGLYLNPPQDEIVISADDKPCIQAIKRPVELVYTSSKKLNQGFKNTFVSHGNLNLFAALEVTNCQIHTKFREKKRRVE
ncbi:MAG: hypothetical protein LBF22_08865 [Deltaproteobacteria bacterium]|jgi:hypothetical protein|nr:hypothetical protein [Deltaproteobacteria bacterium]